MSIYNEITPQVLLDDTVERLMKLISLPYRTKTKREEKERQRNIHNCLLVIRSLRFAGIQPNLRYHEVQLLDRNVNNVEVIYSILNSRIN